MAGFYPSVLRIQNPPPTYIKVEGGTVEAEASPAAIKFFDRTRGRAFMHPTSVNFSVGKFESSWLVYTQMTATSKLFVREGSMAPVYSMLLFGGELSMHLEKALITVDDWAVFSVPPHVGVYIKELRQVLDDVLEQKIQDPSYELSTNRAVALIMRLIEMDGF